MSQTIEIEVSASRYADHDDSLTAAAADYASAHGLEGWDLSPRWADEERASILLSVPAAAVVSVEADFPRATEYGVAKGVDVDVTVRLSDGREIDGEVTLLPDAHDGRYTSWGEGVHHWVGGPLLRALRDAGVDGAFGELAAVAGAIADEYVAHGGEVGVDPNANEE